MSDEKTMSDELIITLDKARAAMIKGEFELAKALYDSIHDEDMTISEASFFSALLHYEAADDIEGYTEKNKLRALYANLMILTARPFVLEVKADKTISEDIQVYLIGCMLNVVDMKPRFGFKMRFLTAKEMEEGIVLLYQLGDTLKEEYGNHMDLAVQVWKEAIATQREFYGYKYNGIDPETYAAEIKKVEPDYVMPAKPGCVSVG